MRIKTAVLVAFCAVLAVNLTAVDLTAVQADQPIQHSFFIAGPTFTGIIDEDGHEVWDAGRPGARDGYVLPSGHVLIAWADEVKELTASHEVVFHYRKSSVNKEIGTAQRLANGNTLITELGPKPRLMEVDAAGKIVVNVPLQPETDNAHMQTRMARKLPNGNYIVPHLLAFKVKEYTPAGKVVRSIATDLEELGGRAAENWPFTAILLDDDSLLVNLMWDILSDIDVDLSDLADEHIKSLRVVVTVGD